MGLSAAPLLAGALPCQRSLWRGGTCRFRCSLRRATRGRGMPRPCKGESYAKQPVGAGFFRPFSWTFIQHPSRAAEVGAEQRYDYTHPYEKETPSWGPGVSPGRFKEVRGFLRGLRGEFAIPPGPLGRRRHSLLLVNTSRGYPSVSLTAATSLRWRASNL